MNIEYEAEQWNLEHDINYTNCNTFRELQIKCTYLKQQMNMLEIYFQTSAAWFKMIANRI